MPDKRLRKSPLAKKEIASLARYYLAEAGLSVAERFAVNAERAFAQLAAMPEIGTRVGFRQPSYADVRRWHIDGFPRLVVLYRVNFEFVDILRVLDGARDIYGLFADLPG